MEGPNLKEGCRCKHVCVVCDSMCISGVEGTM